MLQRLPRDQRALQRTEARVQSVHELGPREGLALRQRGCEIGPPLRGQSLQERDRKPDALRVRGKIVAVVVELALKFAKPLVDAEPRLSSELVGGGILGSGRAAAAAGGCVGSDLLCCCACCAITCCSACSICCN